jgi:hypothetical protein
MPNGEIPTSPEAQVQKTYEFLQEFEKRNSLVDAIKFALSNQCQCESCKKLRIAAEVLEEDRKKGVGSLLNP